MISLSKPNAMGCLAEFSRMDPLPQFDALAFQNCKRATRTQLCSNQRHQCGYCERPIQDSGQTTNLAHMLSQQQHPEKRFEITNLLASCQTAETCDQKQKSHDLPADLDPYQVPNLQDLIGCSSDGTLDFSQLPQAAAHFAEAHLNLNSQGLKTQRATIIAGIHSMTVSLGTNARKRLQNLPVDGVGFRSLYYQQLKRFGYRL